MANKTYMDREQYVVKANDLIRKTRYSLTTQQQKIILYAISKIKPNDPPDTTYEISIDELCRACGIDLDGGGFYYREIKNDLQKLTTRLWVRMPDRSERTVSWISDAMIIPLSGKVYIKFHEGMTPFLFQLRERYTQYALKNVLVFKGKYSIRLYEILRSYTTQQALEENIERTATFTMAQLREVLDVVDSYPRWAELDRCIIRKAVDEINNCSDEMHVEYETFKEGRTITRIDFIITTAHATQMIRAHKEQRTRLSRSPRKSK